MELLKIPNPKQNPKIEKKKKKIQGTNKIHNKMIDLNATITRIHIKYKQFKQPN